MKSVLYSLIIFAMSFSLHAQVGIGTTTPNGALEITSSNNGLLIPRVALISTTDITTVVTGTESELVYNTTLASGMTDVSPGFYYLSAPGGPWVRLGETSSSPPPPPPPPVDAGWSLTGNAGIVDGTNFLGTITGTDVDVAFRRNGLAAGVIGDSNTSYGLESLIAATPGTQNIALGINALRNNTGNDNVGIGFGAMLNNTGGTNIGIGLGVLGRSANVSGGFNVGIGRIALEDNTSGASNTAIGDGALNRVTTGSNNTALGAGAGGDYVTSVPANIITTGSNNTAIGYRARVGVGTASNQVRIGNTAITDATIQVAWTNPSDRRWKESIKDSGLGLDFLQTLRPVSYIRKNDNRKRTEYGFIAQELDEALNIAGDKNNAIISIDDAGMYGVRYNDFISITVKAVQEQQELIKKLQKDNEELKTVNAAILKRLEALENK